MKVYLITVIALVAAACSSGGDDGAIITPVGNRQSLTFAAGVTETRAPLESTGQHNTFGVWAWKRPAATPSVPQAVLMRADANTPYRVAYDAASWSYDDFQDQFLHYWDANALRYKFCAFAPYRPSTTATAADIAAYHNANGTQAASEGWLTTKTEDANFVSVRTKGTNACTYRITGVTGNTATSIEWLAATHLRYMDWEGKTLVDEDSLAALTDAARTWALTNYYDPVRLRFHHLTSLIEFRVYNESGDAVTLTGLSVLVTRPLYTKADYNGLGNEFHDITGNWLYPYTDRLPAKQHESTDYYDLLTLDTGFNMPVTATTRPAAQTVQTPIVEVPQYFVPSVATGSMGVLIGLRVQGSDDWRWSAVKQQAGGWMPDTHYIYYIRINGDNNIILLDIDVEDYAWADGNNSDEIITTDW